VDQEYEQRVVAEIGHQKKPVSMANDAGFCIKLSSTKMVTNGSDGVQ
jgi:hypothetical protein